MFELVWSWVMFATGAFGIGSVVGKNYAEALLIAAGACMIRAGLGI